MKSLSFHVGAILYRQYPMLAHINSTYSISTSTYIDIINRLHYFKVNFLTVFNVKVQCFFQSYAEIRVCQVVLQAHTTFINTFSSLKQGQFVKVACSTYYRTTKFPLWKRSVQKCAYSNCAYFVCD